MKKILGNLLICIISLCASLLLAEFILRKIIFSHSEAFKKLKSAGSYADSSYETDYWTLYSIFDQNNRPPKNPHPLLGWIGDFDRGTLLHNKAIGTINKRPVLLYGDSYAQCLGAICYEEFLNKDSVFSRNNYFLNYGTGGYGVDQIYLLMHNTAFHFKNPFVIFSLMVGDLDRSMLLFRTGQKPKFEIQGDSLILTNVPINHNGEEYLKNHPPKIRSYLWRLFLYSKINFFPRQIKDKMMHYEEYRNAKIKLNGMILQKAVDDLRAHQTDFIFVIFHNKKIGGNGAEILTDNDWRDKFLLDFLHKNNIPYIWSKEVIRTDTAFHRNNLDKYILHHPTSYLNRLVADQMKKAVLENENTIEAVDSTSVKDHAWYYIDRIKEFELQIRNDSIAFNNCIALSRKNNISEEEAVFSSAIELFNTQYENNHLVPLK